MTRDDIIRMAREAGLNTVYAVIAEHEDGTQTVVDHRPFLERFAALVVAAEREKLAHWMRNLGYATGHGDTIEDLLDHLGTQISEGLEVEVLMEREACAKVCESEGARTDASWVGCATAIRARRKT